MCRKSKYSYEQKITIVLRCLKGTTSVAYEANQLGVSPKSIREWLSSYQSLGESGLMPTSKNVSYSIALKQSAVLDYCHGKGSYLTICAKYGIRSSTQLRNWVLRYNGHEKLKSSTSGGKTIMAKGRPTTFEERIAIVRYCIEHGHNYNETAKTYHISYQQARNYTLKYEAEGLDGLKDNRGRRKQEDELTELEQLRAENRLLKAQKNHAEMEVSFLKKLKEIERRLD